jgi:hypothetical protein
LILPRTLYTSGNFQSLLKARKSIHSESRKGNYYDNALMEWFYRTIKRELIQDAHYETPEQARDDIFKIHKIRLTLCLQNLDSSKIIFVSIVYLTGHTPPPFCNSLLFTVILLCISSMLPQAGQGRKWV